MEAPSYDLMLKCTSCGLKKRVPEYPEAGAFPLGTILDCDNIAIFKKGCLRCGVCRFSVESIPPPPPPPKKPVGWSDKMGS